MDYARSIAAENRAVGYTNYTTPLLSLSRGHYTIYLPSDSEKCEAYAHS